MVKFCSGVNSHIYIEAKLGDMQQWLMEQFENIYLIDHLNLLVDGEPPDGPSNKESIISLGV